MLSKTRAVVGALATIGLVGCSSSTDPRVQPRTYRMGFSHIPPRLTVPDVLRTLDEWEPRGDAALMLVSPPWRSLLADTAASVIIRREYFQIAERHRAKGLPIVVMIDATDGLNRNAEASELIALGRSIGEPAIRALYREFAIAADTVLHPDYLGVAMETNLVRAIAPPALYANLRTIANEAAAALRARGTAAKLFASVQVETAWGKLPETNTFAGIAQDRADFPFMDVLGLSSYPNMTTFAEPEQLPDDYYSRLVPDASLPMMVVEGGWASVPVRHPSSPALQARYIRRQMAIADRAKLIAVFQLTFTDLDPASYGDPGSQLAPFGSMGLMTTEFAEKPALAEWDRVFARPFKRP
jgi:hypothetical protein